MTIKLLIWEKYFNSFIYRLCTVTRNFLSIHLNRKSFYYRRPKAIIEKIYNIDAFIMFIVSPSC